MKLKMKLRMNIHDVRRWHGLVGAVIVFFVFYLLISGLILNHVDIFKLDRKEVSSSWLMSWYDIPTVEPTQGYLIGNNYLTWGDGKWVLGDKLLSGSMGQPIGAVEAKGINYVATSLTLYLYQADGQLLDKMEKQSLPSYPILALGKINDDVMLKTPFATYVRANGQNWEKSSAAGAMVSSMQDLPSEVKERSAEILAPGIPVQRLLSDIHSGRIFGPYAIWVMDIASLVLFVLAISGFWLYWRLR
jgi:hypothetical protein